MSCWGEVIVEPGSEEVDDLHETDGAQSHGQSQEAPDVGHKVHSSVQLIPLLHCEVQGFVVQMQHCQIIRHIGLILELGMQLWNKGTPTVYNSTDSVRLPIPFSSSGMCNRSLLSLTAEYSWGYSMWVQLGRHWQLVSVVWESMKPVSSTVTKASCTHSTFSGEQIGVVSGSLGM